MRLALLLLTLFILQPLAAAKPPMDGTARSPNVVILYTDDQGTLDANCYGSADLHTPNIDRIARDGVRFTQAYAHIVCCPSRARAARLLARIIAWSCAIFYGMYSTRT